jgi:hypothetical protein
MSLDIRQDAATAATLGEHAKIAIAFVVDRVLEVTLADRGLGGARAHADGLWRGGKHIAVKDRDA